MPRPRSSTGSSPRLIPRLIGPVAVLAALGVVLVGCSAGPAGTTSPSAPASAPAAASTSTSPAASTSASPDPASTAAAGQASGLGAADTAAGLLSRTVVWEGSGRLRVVPGTTKAPSKGRVVRVRVDVESGLKVNGRSFATFVLATLNDRRSWTHDGYTFARTTGSYDVRVVLASPATSARLCRPLVTYGKLSCGTGSTAVLTMYRWIKAIPEYRSDPTGYRHYVVNHEVGHTLGHHHEYCAGKGEVAPVMMQQTKGLRGCRPNPWPYP